MIAAFLLAAAVPPAPVIYAPPMYKPQPRPVEVEWQDANSQTKRLYAAGRFSEALVQAERTVTLARTAFGPESTQVASSLNNLAACYNGLERLAEAEQAYRSAMPLYERNLGKQHVRYAVLLNNLAEVLKNRDKFADSMTMFKQAIGLLDGNPDPFARSTLASALNNYGQLLFYSGRPTEAEPFLLQSMGLMKDIYGESHPELAATLANLAFVHVDLNRFAEARILLISAIRMVERAYGPRHTDVAIYRNALAETLVNLKQFPDALVELDKAKSIVVAEFGETSPRMAHLLNSYALYHEGQKQNAEAENFMSVRWN